MDKKELVEATARKTAGGVSAEVVEDVIDALFGTVEKSGSIAEALRAGDPVTLLGFGGFEPEYPEHGDGRVTVRLRLGRALLEYVRSA